MIRGFYTASTGLRAYQEQMNMISNNMANVNTVAYKSMRPSFADLIYQNINRPEANNEAMVGHGIRIVKSDIDISQGNLQSTDRWLDFALQEENNYFMVETDTGEIRYTRAGSFHLSNDDDDFYLVDGNGYRVLDEDEEAIEIEFDDDGKIELDPTLFGVVRFANPYGLLAAGGNTYIASETSGEPEILETASLRAGYLEGSNVDIASEMVQVIESSKAFTFSSRMVQVADEVEQVINSLR